jgi:hypothetical protein
MPSYERPPIYIGPTFGFNSSLHSATLESFSDPDQAPICPNFEDGANTGFWVGLTWEQMLGDVKNSISSIIVRALYSSLPASFEEAGNRYPTLPTNTDANGNVTSTGEPIYTSTQHTNEVTYNIISVEACYKLNPIPGINLGFTLGPTFDYVLASDQDQRFNLIEPNNASFSPDPNSPYQYTNDNRSIIVSEGEIPGSSAFRLGLKAGVQYEIILKNRAYVVPAVYYNFGVTNLSSEDDWRVNALQAGVDIRFAL